MSEAPRPQRFRRLEAAAMLAGAGFVVLHVWNQSRALGGPLAYDRWQAATRHPLQGPLFLAVVAVPMLFVAVQGARRWFADGRVQGWRRASTGPRYLGLGTALFVAFHLWLHRWPLLAGERSRTDLYDLSVELFATTRGGLPVTAGLFLLGLAVAILFLATAVPRLWEALGGPLPDAWRPRALRGASWAGWVLFLLGAWTVVHYATGLGLGEDPWRWEPSGGAAYGG